MKEEAANGEGYEGERHSDRGLMKFWERSIIRGKDCILCFIFFWFWSLGGLLQGCTRLLGVFGFGARNTHKILELGSRTDSVPSW
jgi:hypothetical protein